MINRIEALNTLHSSTLISLFFFGIAYAWYIRFRPMKRAWLSVAIGTGMITLAITWDIYRTFIIYGLWHELGWMTFIPIVGLLTAGIPMALMQEHKFRQQRRRNREIAEKWRDADD